MTKPSPDTRITHATVEAAMRDARNGIEWEHRDPECTGLILRARGGAVSWNFRGPRSGGKHQRWMLGAHTVSPRDARQRAWAVRTYIQRGIDPTTMLTELVTGATPAEQLDLRVTNKPSWKWEKAIARFLAGIADNAREATIGDYRATLQNTPQLAKFRGRWVCDILREEIEEVVEEIRLRGVTTHHKKVLVVTRRFFNWMAEGARRRETSVAVNFLHAAKAGAPMRDVEGRRVVNKGIPDALPIGRALAIARSDVLGALPSLGIMMVLGSVSRRRGVVGMRIEDVRPYSPTILNWFQPPAFRKTADKIQSSAAHQVPLVGWTADIVGDLQRLLTEEQWEAGWLFPAARPRTAGEPPKNPYMATGVLNKNMDAMPGVHDALSPHAIRRAFGSYGSKIGRFADGEAKMILDHTEGVGDDVTRGHYDLDPRMERKVEMMTWWTGWLDEQCNAAIEADPTLKDKEALRQACYIERYGREQWDAKLAKVRETGTSLWPKPRKARPTLSTLA